MNCGYALFVLEDRKKLLEEKINNESHHEVLSEIHGENNIKNLIAKMKRDLYDLNFAIEILEEYRGSE